MEDPVAKIENEAQKAPARENRYEVLVSFDGLDKGDFFSAADDDWAQKHVATGYLRVLQDEEPGREIPDGEQGHISPR